MTSPGINPPPDARSGRMGALRDNYRKVKVPKEQTDAKRPWYKMWRRTKSD